jgi:hypothetical protein
MTDEVFTNEENQEFEKDWWGDCLNTFGEEAKQISYAHRMELVNTPALGKWPVYDLEGKSIIDIGGGPVSMLLKATNLREGTVVEPCDYPSWVSERYAAAGIEYAVEEAETFIPSIDYDECWIYNVLQHVVDPALIIEKARCYSDKIRIFEWIDTPATIGHPHTLTFDDLNKWLGGIGTVENINENGAYGKCYYGVFNT